MILKHKDRALLRFDWVNPFGVKNLELDSREVRFLPLSFRELATAGSSRRLTWAVEDWLLHRTAPMNRRFVRDMMLSLGFNPGDPRYQRHLLEFCHGLSLNDVHWVVPDDFNGTWANCNLYENAFPETIASLAFSGLGRPGHGDASTSPEYTTDGVLAKCWRRNDKGIFLYKAGKTDSGLEPYAEFYTSQVAAALGISHINYRLARYRNRVCSVCPLFTNERLGFIPAGKLMTHEEITSDSRFADIFLLDAVVLNDDRHLSNFGFLIDNDRNEIVDPAPAFDHGHAFFSRLPERFAEGTPALYETWERFPGLDRAHATSLLQRLVGFHLKKDARFNLSARTFSAASEFLSRRIDRLLATYKQPSKGGPVKVELTGPTQLLAAIESNPGLRTNALARLTGLTERTVKRYLSQLKGKVIFKGAPKTGGYHLRK